MTMKGSGTKCYNLSFLGGFWIKIFHFRRWFSTATQNI